MTLCRCHLLSPTPVACSTSIEDTLNEGTTIICDRYAFSGVAFSASKGLPFEWCRTPDIGLPAPDLSLFLDISPEKAKERGGYGEERYEKEEMQRRVRQIFLGPVDVAEMVLGCVLRRSVGDIKSFDGRFLRAAG